MVKSPGKNLTVPNSSHCKNPTKSSQVKRPGWLPLQGQKEQHINSRKLSSRKSREYAIADEVGGNRSNLLSGNLPFVCINISVKRLKRP